jgi:phosphoserine aminotransferase
MPTRYAMRIDETDLSVLVLCSCGWRSGVHASRETARAAALEHRHTAGALGGHDLPRGFRASIYRGSR